MSINKRFPFTVIPQNSKVVIYGAGDFGKYICYENSKINWCNILWTVDINWETIDDFWIPVMGIESLVEDQHSYEYIYIAILDSAVRRKVELMLIKMGISAEKIINYVDMADNTDEYLNILVDETDDECEDSHKVTVAFIVGTPIGDQIIALKLYQELARLSGNISIDVYSGSKSLTEIIYYDQPNIGTVYGYYPGDSELLKYDIAIYADFIPRLKVFRRQIIKRTNYELWQAIEKLYSYQITCSPGCDVPVFQRRVLIDRAKFFHKNRYTLLGISGAFDIKDTNVKVNVNENYEESYETLDLKRPYITIHYGASNVLKNGKQQTKIWPLEYCNRLCELHKKKYPDVEIIQIGTKDEPAIAHVDRCINDVSLEVVKYIVLNADYHIDCESGLVHLATQLGTKCFVMFGPTPVWFFGYENNCNILPTMCGECKGMVNDWYTHCMCYDRPECMYSILPEKVIGCIEDYRNEGEK